MLALCNAFERKGMSVSKNKLSAKIDKVIINSYNFNEIVFRHLKHPNCRVLHRVDGPISVYRNSDTEIDEMIHGLNNRYANCTVFQSDYSLQKHTALGLNFNDACVIHNTVDPALFNQENRVALPDSGPIKVITVSWSINPNKGWKDYQRFAELLDENRYEFTYLGRAPGTHPKIRCLPVTDSTGVAAVLKESHIYITASRHESCSNSVLEALACGLPAVYIKSGSNPELINRAGLGFEKIEEAPALLDNIVAHYTSYQENICIQTMDKVADRYLEILNQK